MLAKELFNPVYLLVYIFCSPSKGQECAAPKIITPSNDVVNGSLVTDSITFKCSHSSGNSYSWFLNGSPVQGQNQFFWVWLQPFPGGVVECGNETHCDSLSSPVTVIVPPLIDSSLLMNKTFDIGTNFSLKCESTTGYPSPSFSWYFDGTAVASGSELVVVSATLSNTGKYTCLASNDAGYTTLAVWVTIVSVAPIASSLVPSSVHSIVFEMASSEEILSSLNHFTTQAATEITTTSTADSVTTKGIVETNGMSKKGAPPHLDIILSVTLSCFAIAFLVATFIVYQSRSLYKTKKRKANRSPTDHDIDDARTMQTSTSYINASFKDDKGNDDDDNDSEMRVELFANNQGDINGSSGVHVYKNQTTSLFDSGKEQNSSVKDSWSEKSPRINEQSELRNHVRDADNHYENMNELTDDVKMLIDSGASQGIESSQSIEQQGGQSIKKEVPALTVEEATCKPEYQKEHNSEWLKEMRNKYSSRSHVLSAKEVVDLVHKLDLLSVENFTVHPLNEEFSALPYNLSSSREWPYETMSKNRYRDIIPTPKTAVTLSNTGDPTSTYINANFIRGFDGYQGAYISAQAPTYDTVPDFWRMIWENKIDTIVMLTGIFEGGKNKCAKYWPSSSQDNGILTYGKYVVQNVHEESQENYKITFLTVSLLDDPREERDVYHFSFLGWPDFGVPIHGYSMMQLRDAVESIRNPDSTLLVHCSAGIGRSGTYIGIDIAIRQFAQEGVVDPQLILYLMRQDRGGMIQSLEQYEFLYRVVSNYVVNSK